MTLIADLYALQEIDSHIDQDVAALESLRAPAPENEALEEARLERAEHEVGLPELESRQRDLELQSAGLREKAGPVERKLYDGSITIPKELSDLQLDLDQINRHRQALEDELLSVLEQIEAKRAAIAAIESQIEEMESQSAAELAGNQADESRLEGELVALRERRGSAAGRIPGQTLVAYDRLRRRRRGVAVVRVERGTCLGCRLTVPTVVLQRARSGTNPNPVQCPSCERMLYVI
jgi:predicted  nucleic acid-binding Zn-ribbon protein